MINPPTTPVPLIKIPLLQTQILNHTLYHAEKIIADNSLPVSSGGAPPINVIGIENQPGQNSSSKMIGYVLVVIVAVGIGICIYVNQNKRKNKQK